MSDKVWPALKLAGKRGVRGSIDGRVEEATFNYPYGIAADNKGCLYVSDYGSHLIRKISSGEVTTIAGSTRGYKDANGRNAQFSSPQGITLDSFGNLYVVDYWEPSHSQNPTQWRC